jgi:HEAT repeat protein
MNPQRTISPRSAAATASLAAIASTASAATESEVKDFLARIQSDDADTRLAALTGADKFGVPAIVPLGDATDGKDSVAAHYLIEALKNIAYRSAATGRKAIAAELVKLLEAKRSRVLRTAVLQLLSVIGDEAVVAPIAALLGDKEIRDDARMALERISGLAALKSLTDALDKADNDFKISLLASLGEKAAPEAQDALAAATDSSVLNVQLAALDAFSRVGGPRDDRVKIPDWETLAAPQQIFLGNAWLRWADRRAAKGDKDSALQAYGVIFKNSRDEHFACAALIGAAKVAPDDTAPYAIEALGNEAGTVRHAAAEILTKHSGNETLIAQLNETAKTAETGKKALIEKILAAWKARK